MKLECTVEELIKIVSAKQTDTIEIKEPSVSSVVIEKLNQEKNQQFDQQKVQQKAIL